MITIKIRKNSKITIVLDGRRAFVYTKESEVYEKDELTGFYRFKETVCDFKKDYILREVSYDDLTRYRSKLPGIVLKENDKLYFAEVDKEARFTGKDIIGENICINPSRWSCRNYFKNPNFEGGCEKAYQYQPRIEDFDFIELGYECFNTKEGDAFVVLKCKHYDRFKEK